MVSKQWSSALKEQTREALESLSFATRAGKVWLKQVDGKFGYIDDADALRGVYAICAPGGEAVAMFDSVTELLVAGWVLD